MRLRQSLLDPITIEYRFVESLFLRTYFFGARRPDAPTINPIKSILKLENKTVQVNFMNELAK